MLARAPLHAPGAAARPWVGCALALVAMGLLVHGGAIADRIAFPEPLAGAESLAAARAADAVPAHLGPLHALLLLALPSWLPGLRILLGALPLAAAALVVEAAGRRLLGVPWTGMAWAGLLLVLWPAFGSLDAASAVPLLTLCALGAWAATAVESRPGLRAPLVAAALAAAVLAAAVLLHPAGIALLALPFLLAREDRRQAAGGALALLVAGGLLGAGLLPHAFAAALALAEPDAGARAIEALWAILPLALPGLAAPLLLARIEGAGPRDPEWSLAATALLLAAGGLAAVPLLGAAAVVPAALVGIAGMALLLGGLAMGRSEAPLRAAALGGALLVAGILAADLPHRREAPRPTDEDAAARAALAEIARLAGAHAPRWPHLGPARADAAPLLRDAPADGLPPRLVAGAPPPPAEAGRR